MPIYLDKKQIEELKKKPVDKQTIGEVVFLLELEIKELKKRVKALEDQYLRLFQR